MTNVVARPAASRALFFVAAIVATSHPALADTLPDALHSAYVGNPAFNAGRAGLRATDENVPRALSGYRPTVTASASAGLLGRNGVISSERVRDTLPQRQFGLQINQNLFNGFRTANSTQQAESQVLGAREELRQTEQSTLFSAAQAYMNVLRDTAILDLQRNNARVLEEQLRQTEQRRIAGEITRTDVAQAESRLAAARSQLSAAGSNLQTSIAEYRRIIGREPRRLAPGRPPDRLLPATLRKAVARALTEHPSIVAAYHAVDVAELQVKIVESELAPVLSVVGSVGQSYATEERNDRLFAAAIVGQLTIPIYQGGEVSARVRQAKEISGQRRIEAETVRDEVRAGVLMTWGALETAKAQIKAAQAQAQAAEVALRGVREEARVGQRTTLEVLNQQQELVNARVNLVIAQRDRVVGTFAVAQAVGTLSARSLALPGPRYRAADHYEAVRDKLWGLQTPDGR
jgi:outer membrane protein